MRPRRFVDTEQLAGLLGVPVSTVRSWRYTGKGPGSYNFEGRNVRYDLDEVEWWIESQATRRPGRGAVVDIMNELAITETTEEDDRGHLP